MSIPYPIQSAEDQMAENHAVNVTQITLKYLYGTVPIIAGADKFTNLLAQWEIYLCPALLNIVPISATRFMHLVGIVEILAGILVFIKPRIGGFVVMAWLLAIALQLVVSGHYFDIAVRDIVMAIGGALTLARLTPFVGRRKAS